MKYDDDEEEEEEEEGEGEKESPVSVEVAPKGGDEEKKKKEEEEGEWVTLSEGDVALIEECAQVTTAAAVTEEEEEEEEDEDDVAPSLTAESLKVVKEVVISAPKFEAMTGVECSQLQRYFIENTAVPVPRINASLVIRGCSLFVYGKLG